jgi:hypothetical protein
MYTNGKYKKHVVFYVYALNSVMNELLIKQYATLSQAWDTLF